MIKYNIESILDSVRKALSVAEKRGMDFSHIEFLSNKEPGKLIRLYLKNGEVASDAPKSDFRLIPYQRETN